MRELAMFPLGVVLLPHQVLPLHIFEPRYRALIADVLAGDGEFGVTLITRGHEVGGDDVRADVGTVARVVQAEQLEDGRWLVLAVGTRRIQVARWLPDDPYPRAEVAPLLDHGPAPAIAPELEQRLRRVLALHAELGGDGVPPDVTLDDDPEVTSWQLAVVAPLSAFDTQQVLTTTDPAARLTLLAELLGGLEEVLRFRLDTSEDPT